MTAHVSVCLLGSLRSVGRSVVRAFVRWFVVICGQATIEASLDVQYLTAMTGAGVQTASVDTFLCSPIQSNPPPQRPSLEA